MYKIFTILIAAFLSGSLVAQTSALAPKHHHLAVDEVEGKHRLKSDVNTLAFSIYPNPTGSEVWLKYTVGADAEVNISIADIIGKQVYEQKTQMRPGEHVLPLNMDELDLTTGAYFVTLTNGKQSITKKLIRK